MYSNNKMYSYEMRWMLWKYLFSSSCTIIHDDLSYGALQHLKTYNQMIMIFQPNQLFNLYSYEILAKLYLTQKSHKKSLVNTMN